MFVGEPLGTPQICHGAAAVDLAAIIDTCYEHIACRGDDGLPLLAETTRSLDVAAGAAGENGLVVSLEPDPSRPDPSHLAVARALVAALANAGHEAMARKLTPNAADLWLSGWRSRLWSHNRQQEWHTTLCILSALSADARNRVISELGMSIADTVPRSRTFSAGLDEYLNVFGDTSAAALALMGALPFADRLPVEDLDQVLRHWLDRPELLDLVSRTLRLALDVRFDPSEPLSAGIFALAAARGCSVASPELRDLPAPLIEAQLREGWERHSKDTRVRTEHICRDYNASPMLQRTLRDIFDATFAVADALALALAAPRPA